MDAKSATPLPVMNTPFCGDLRSKKFYMRQEVAATAEDYMDLSNHCFCYHTQTTIGVDGHFVEPDACVPGRACYRSALAEPQRK